MRRGRRWPHSERPLDARVEVEPGGFEDRFEQADLSAEVAHELRFRSASLSRDGRGSGLLVSLCGEQALGRLEKAITR